MNGWVFTWMWLRYVRVFAIANNPSLCRLSDRRLWRSCTLLRELKLSAIFSPLCTLAIVWPPCKLLRRSSQGNLSAGGFRRKTGSKIERFWACRRLCHKRVQFMTNRKLHITVVSFNDLDLSGTQISRLSVFSVVNSTEICHTTRTFYESGD